MENSDQVFGLFSFFEEISLNTDILETGLINNIILVVILYIFLSDLLGAALKIRKEKIENDLTTAKFRVEEANKRLEEAERKLSQANLIINEIKIETLVTQKNILIAIADQTKTESLVYLERAFATFKSKERLIIAEIKQQLISLVLQKLLAYAQDKFSKRRPAKKLIRETMLKLKNLEGEKVL